MNLADSPAVRRLTPAANLGKLTIRTLLNLSLFLPESPQMPTLHEMYDEAVKLKDAGKLDDAIAKLREILTLDPSYVLGHSAMSIYLGRLQRHQEAIAHARKVCELAPNDAHSYTNLSVVCVRAGDIQGAEDAKARSYMLAQQPPR